MVEKKVSKRLEKEKRKRTEELRAFEKMSVSDSKHKSISSSSSEEDEI